MPRKPLTPIQQEYRRNRRRIQSAIRRLENRGYLVPENILPAIPKKITPASVRRLESLTTEKLYKRSEYVVQETGEIVPGKRGRKIENKLRTEYKREVGRTSARRKQKQPTPQATDYVDFNDQIFAVFQMEMAEIFGRNERLFNYITRWFNRTLETYGRHDFAEALEKAKDSGDFPGWSAVSDEELLTGQLNRILELIGGSQGSRAEITDYLESMEDWNEPE